MVPETTWSLDVDNLVSRSLDLTSDIFRNLATSAEWETKGNKEERTKVYGQSSLTKELTLTRRFPSMDSSKLPKWVKKKAIEGQSALTAEIIYHRRIRKEEEAWRTYQETQSRERKLEGETNPITENWIRKNIEERKEEGKMQNKWPKLTWENSDMFTRRAYPSRTRGAQPLSH